MVALLISYWIVFVLVNESDGRLQWLYYQHVIGVFVSLVYAGIISFYVSGSFLS